MMPGWFKHFRDAGWISTHWEGVMLIRNRSASSCRSGVTSGISVFVERKPLCRAPATLGGVGDSDPDVGTPVLC